MTDLIRILRFVLIKSLIRFMQHPVSIPGQMESSLKIFVRLQIFRVRNYIQETILKTECAMAFLEPESIHMMQ